jgi:serine/threonine protein kinase
MSEESRTHGRPPDAAPSTDTTTLVANRYEIRELLGRGSMGAVYCARDVVLDRDVALKLFPSEAADAQQAVRYEQEARLLARLSHPGLVTVYDAGIDATVADHPKPYLVMELVRGPTLADRLREGPLPPPEVGELACQLASALAHIHRRDVVHRDIKPANILLRRSDDADPYPSATLTDFGIARLIDGTRITMTGFTLGTANYLSPEQLSGGEVGAPSDIYSLGLVLLECLTGAVAYPGHGVEAALPRLNRPPDIPAAVPDGWRQLLRAMTDLQPNSRPAAAEIASYVGGLAGPPPEDETTVIRTAPPAPAGPLAAAVAGPAQPDADHTRVLPVAEVPAGAAPARVRRRGVRPAMLIGGLAALLVLILVIVYVSSGDGGVSPPSTPRYPTVGGHLGDHLRQLQQDVAP